jgi:L-alanine-DL-glutamate epimerase-like enolase superfamily enzyme
MSSQAAKAVEPMNPLFYEDPLPVVFSEGWRAVKRSTRIPLLVGEKLELVQGFKPFLDTQTADIIHPDLAFAGGFTGTRKIADYAMVTRTPVALHNVGSLILCLASAHFGSAAFNFYRSESALGRPTRHVEQMSATKPPEVKNSHLTVPTGPGLGFEPKQPPGLVRDDGRRSNSRESNPWIDRAAPGLPPPHLLPEVLTPTLVLEELSRLPAVKPATAITQR